MEKLLELAKKFLNENLTFNEVWLSDGINSVKVIRTTPSIWYYQPTPVYSHTDYHYDQPGTAWKPWKP